MCTLAIALHVDRRWPIVVAANRDERLGRPAEDWALRAADGAARHIAPLDLVAGGTWIGLSASGVFAGLTNFFAGAGFPDPSRRSRGALVVRMLSHPDAATARADVERTDARTYNPFHLVVADAREAFLWRYDGRSAELVALRPGLHVVTETDANGRTARGDLVRARWPVHPETAALRELLAQHAPAPRDGTCIHLDPHYGTRSSAVLRVATALGASDLHVATGHPCTAPLVDRSDLLSQLTRPA